MRKLRILLKLFLVMMFVNKAYSQYNEEPLGVMGCWETCLTPALYDTIKFRFPIYSGSDYNIEKKFTTDTTIIIKPKIERILVQDSINPLIYHTTFQEEESVTFNWVLTDTTVTKNFYIEHYEYEIEIGKSRKWYEVICKEDLTRAIEEKIQLRLMELGYLPEMKSVNTKIGNLVQARLQQYQIENGLPSECINILTLISLGIIKNER